jgi:hypothetical protein
MPLVADQDGLTGRVGLGLVAQLADRLGLTTALSEAAAGRTTRRSSVDDGKVLRDVVLMLVDGGDAVSDIATLAEQSALFGAVCSVSTAARVVEALDADGLERIRAARALVRERAWRVGAAPERVIIDIDASLVTSHSEKEGAAATWKRGFGFHPMLGFLADSREALAGLLRPGNAGSNTAADQLVVAAEALRQLPASFLANATREDAAEEERIVIRTDSAGAVHGFLDGVRELGVRFSTGFAIDEPLRARILAVPEWAWQPARNADTTPREGAWVCELAAPAGWPEGARLIVRRERPHPGAQLSFTDIDGHRFQAILTDRHGSITELEREHRARGDAENRVRAAKACGMENLPFHAYAHNEAWLELVLCALDLVAWTERLLLAGTLLQTAEPKTLRYRLLHVAGRITRHGRRATLRIERTWPWRDVLSLPRFRCRRFTRLLPLGGRDDRRLRIRPG